MLDAFASVGATRFDVTWTNAAGDKEWFRRGVSLADLCRTLPAMLDAAPGKQRNVIVRPHGPGVTFIQLDDLKADQLTRLAPAVFLTLETSPGNFQAWAGPRRHRGQGLCPPAEERHRSRPDRQRRNARRRQPQFQGQIRAGFSARGDPRGACGPVTSAAELERLAWSQRRKPCRPALAPRPVSPGRQPQMAELCPLPRRRAAQQRENRPRHQPAPILCGA